MHELALLKLLHLTSPALPIGAYAYSNGQEYAVDCGWITTEQELAEWILGLMQHSLAGLDLPILIRLFAAWTANEHSQICYWNDYIRANRETSELLLEDEQLGLALQRLLISLEIPRAHAPLLTYPSLVCMFALAGVHWEIPLEELLRGFVWSWLENQITAATKTVPLGQSQAQQLLTKLMVEIPAICQYANTVNDDDIGVGLPAVAIASAKHERQYSRLFRS